MRGLRRLSWVVVVISLVGCGGPLEEDEGGGTVAAGGADLETDVVAACGKDTWKSYAATFFKSHCASCHQSAFSTRTKVTSSLAQGDISSGAMPQGKPLSAAARKRVEAWFACGAP